MGTAAWYARFMFQHGVRRNGEHISNGTIASGAVFYEGDTRHSRRPAVRKYAKREYRHFEI